MDYNVVVFPDAEALQKAVSDRADNADKLEELSALEDKYKQSEQHVKNLKKELDDYILKVNY